MSTRLRQKVLVTGALGNIGLHAVRELSARGHKVRAFDLRTPRNERRALDLGRDVEVVWGDIRKTGDVARAVAGQDAVVHLAFVLPPRSETQPEIAEQINVEGTRRLVVAMQSLDPAPVLVLASSYAVHGDTLKDPDLLTPRSPVRPHNNYTRHKVAIEEIVASSRLTHCILRFGAAMSARGVLGGKIDPIVFDLPPDAHQEFLHCDDAALAIANCLCTEEVWGRTLMIGGGSACQLRYADLINRSLEAIGIGALPDRVFSPVARQGGGWMDTSESQRLLGYQRWTFDAHLSDLASRAAYRRPILRLLGPIIRWYLARKSPYSREERPDGS